MARGQMATHGSPLSSPTDGYLEGMRVSAVSLRSDIKEREGTSVLSPCSHIVHDFVKKIKKDSQSVHCDPLWYDRRVGGFRGT